MRGRFTTTAGVLFLLAGDAAAQVTAPTLPGTTPERQEAARELVQTLHLDQQLASIMGAYRDQLVERIQQTGKSAAEAATVVDEVLMPELRSRTGELANALSAGWASQLSVEDMHAVIDFYGTAAGRRLLAAYPVVYAMDLAAWRAWFARVAPEAIAKHAEELRRRGVAL